MFHIIAEGHCWVALEDGVKRDLSRGDVVVMPYGDAHSMGSPAYAEPVSIATLLPPRPWTEFPHVEYGGCGEHTLVVCGYLRGDAVLFDPVLRALPSLFVVRPPAGPAAAWVTACVDYALMASQSLHGAARMNHRLPELLFTEVLRLYLDGSCDAELTGWLAALRDPVVGQALSLLHAQPARDWTVAELAVAVAASKTVPAPHPVPDGMAAEPGLRTAPHDGTGRRRDQHKGWLHLRGGFQPGVQTCTRQGAGSLASRPAPTTPPDLSTECVNGPGRRSSLPPLLSHRRLGGSFGDVPPMATLGEKLPSVARPHAALVLFRTSLTVTSGKALHTAPRLGKTIALTRHRPAHNVLG